METSESELVHQLKKRDPIGLEQLMDLYGNPVLGLVTRVLSSACSREDIEECVSDAFVAAWHKIDEYDPGKGSLKTWLLILAKYKALDYRRKRSVRPSTQVLSEEPPHFADTEHIVLMKEEKDELIHSIESLEELDRTIFYKRYFFYESLETIAASLGLTRKAVEGRLARSRKLLKQKLYPEAKEGMS
jgi:RNA polymerase sigma-70 factor, ECF subfamily